MPTIHIISANSALRAAIQEQLRGDGEWEVEAFDAIQDAARPWAIVVEDTAIKLGLPPTESLIFVIGESGGIPSADIVTESFSKPLRLGYLLARLRFYRTAYRQSATDMALGAYVFSPQNKTLTANGSGETVKLTEKETALLDYLCRAEQPVPRDELLAEVWGYDGTIDTHTLETHLYRLRQSVPDGQEMFVVEKGCYAINPAWRAG